MTGWPKPSWIFSATPPSCSTATGLVRLGAAIDVGYYEQSQLSLHDEKTVIDEIWDLHPQMTQTEVRSALAVFLFKGEDVFKPVGALSAVDLACLVLLPVQVGEVHLVKVYQG